MVSVVPTKVTQRSSTQRNSCAYPVAHIENCHSQRLRLQDPVPPEDPILQNHRVRTDIHRGHRQDQYWQRGRNSEGPAWPSRLHPLRLSQLARLSCTPMLAPTCRADHHWNPRSGCLKGSHIIAQAECLGHPPETNPTILAHAEGTRHHPPTPTTSE